MAELSSPGFDNMVLVGPTYPFSTSRSITWGTQLFGLFGLSSRASSPHDRVKRGRSSMSLETGFRSFFALCTSAKSGHLVRRGCAGRAAACHHAEGYRTTWDDPGPALRIRIRIRMGWAAGRGRAQGDTLRVGVEGTPLSLLSWGSGKPSS